MCLKKWGFDSSFVANNGTVSTGYYVLEGRYVSGFNSVAALMHSRWPALFMWTSIFSDGPTTSESFSVYLQASGQSVPVCVPTTSLGIPLSLGVSVLNGLCFSPGV